MREETRYKLQQALTLDGSTKKILATKSKGTISETIPKELVDKYKSEGWDIIKEYKSGTRVEKAKPEDVLFEDEVWTLCAKMGFHVLNKDRYYRIPYSSHDEKLTQQIDVLAADDETMLIIECKSTQGEPKQSSFKEAIEAIGGKKDGILTTVRQLFPDRKYKVKFIFATRNYYLSEQDKNRLDNYGILHFDDETFKYYQDLTKHLGFAAKYQLLGNVFEGQEIPEIENKIPAIKGKMGGYTYYSFSIEPDKLLKIGYVLHRSKANRKLMPTYQRLIKKSRLKAVKNFVDDGGFFPNSIIINIDTGGKNLRFESSSSQVENSISKIGILHLPKKYRSAYIIDGQHRLYGYIGSVYGGSNTIPVVAFVNLDRKQQVELFMQINENQKPVPKNLRNTLNSDLLWKSENKNDQIKALKLQLALDLGEELDSPLYDRIITGENPKTSRRCITIETIKVGLDRSNFFGTFDKYSIKEDGTFYKGNNESTLSHLLPYLKLCLGYIKESMPEEWIKGEQDDGLLVTNGQIESLIRIFSDIADHLTKTSNIQIKACSATEIFNESEYYLAPLVDFYKGLSHEARQELRKSYGVAGRTKVWRTLQKCINAVRQDFQPEGLEKYWKDEDKRYNEESFKIIRDIETFMKNDFKNKLEGVHGKNWFKLGVPKAVYDKATALASEKNYTITDGSAEVHPWDCLTLIDYRRIATYSANWSNIFDKSYTRPGEEKISGGKEAKTEWMQKLESIRNNNFHSYSVKEEEYNFLVALHDWLISE